MILFFIGVLAGGGLGSLWVWIYYEHRLRNVDRLHSTKCFHDRLEMHSTSRYANTAYAHAVCLDCGKPQKIEIGFVSDSQSAQVRATDAAMTGRGYHVAAGNTYERNTANTNTNQ